MASKPQFEIKPTTFSKGVPKTEHNGFYGIEEHLVDLPIGRDIPTLAMYRMKDDKQQRGPGIRYPEVEIVHLEPLWDVDDPEQQEIASEVAALLQRAYKLRTGQNQLDFSGLDKAAKPSKDEAAS